MAQTHSTMTGQVKTASGLNIVLGGWLILASFILGFSNLTVALWDNIVVGIIILLLAWSRVANPTQSTSASWINAILGLWLIVAPFILGFSGMAAPMWNSIISGIAIAVFGVWSAMVTNSSM